MLGVLYALVDADLKRLLAYSSVENIGIIMLGLGAAMLFQASNLPGLAALALVAGLYHTLNHAAFKSLLFMGAGAVLHATHTRNMEELGGLIKRMPQTALFFLIGSLAIAALPPFNGFISEWLTFQALLLSFQISGAHGQFDFRARRGRARADERARRGVFCQGFRHHVSRAAAQRSTPRARAKSHGRCARPMALLALVVCRSRRAPSLILAPLEATVFDLMGAHADMQFDWNAVVANERIRLGRAVVDRARACRFSLGDSARAALDGRQQSGGAITKHGAAGARYRRRALNTPQPRSPILSNASSPYCIGPVKDLDIEFHPESRYFVRTIEYYNEGRLIFEDTIVRAAAAHASRRWRARARVLQSGNVHGYLVYILVALVALLILTV